MFPVTFQEPVQIVLYVQSSVLYKVLIERYSWVKVQVIVIEKEFCRRESYILEFYLSKSLKVSDIYFIIVAFLY